MLLRAILLSLITFTLTCCTNHSPSSRFSKVEQLIDTEPASALDSLKTINRQRLSRHDQHYYDFLTIKAHDKAYILHTSDSLYLSILDYYSQHTSDKVYPEVLYYGGRVYSDLGDYPTALKYFQASNDILSGSDADIELKGRVVSQTGRLLNSLRLFDEAIPFLKESIDIDRQLNDSIGEVYDLQLLGVIYLRAHETPEAEKYFRLALNRSRYLDSTHMAESSMYLGAAKYRLGEIDSALIYIRETPSTVHPMVRNSALSYAIKIYYDAGLKDTAFIYARQLIENKDPLNKATAYNALLSTELRNRLHPDSIGQYLSDYLSLLESYYNEGQINMAINQQSLHNYDLHLKHRQEAERFNLILKRWFTVIALVALTLAVIILLLKNRNKKNIINLHIALDNINRLEDIIQRQQNNSKTIGSLDNPPISTEESEESIPILRQKLREKLLDIYNSNHLPASLSTTILQSASFTKLQSYIDDNREIKETDPFWNELKDAVLESSPQFIGNLRLLTGGKLNSYDLHTALLIKCGVTPTQMTHLLNRTKGTITSRRESLCFRVFDEKLGTKVIDAIIRLL